MEERGVAPDVNTFNSVINVLRWGGQGELALEVLAGMNRASDGAGDGQGRQRRVGGGGTGEEESKGGSGAGAQKAVRPDVVTYSRAIAACAGMDGGSG